MHNNVEVQIKYSKTYFKRPLKKKTKIGFQVRFSLNFMIHGLMQVKSIAEEHSIILSTFINLPFVFKTFDLSILSGRLRQILLYIHVTDASG